MDEIRKIIREGVAEYISKNGVSIKVLPKTFNHLKWDFNRNQKYHLQELCEVDPESITDNNFNQSSSFLGIPEKNLRSIINTYSSYKDVEPMYENPLNDVPITNKDLGQSIEQLNNGSVRSKKTFQPNRSSDFMSISQKAYTNYTKNKGRQMNDKDLGKYETIKENTTRSMMLYLLAELKPKNISYSNNKITIDQNPELNEGENFSMENKTFKKVNKLIEVFNEKFDTMFRIYDHLDYSNKKLRSHRTIIEYDKLSRDKMFWCSESKSYKSRGDKGYTKLRNSYIKSGHKIKMPEIPMVDHKEMLKKYYSGDLISLDNNADWLL